MLSKPKFCNLFDPTQSPRLEHPVYNSREIDDLLLYFDWFVDKPSARAVKNILYATQTFRNITDPLFADLRKKNKTLKDLSKELDDIANALIETKNELDKLPQNSLDYTILDSAYKYCSESIQRRIESLKETKDDIYLKAWPTSELKKILENAPRIHSP